jgi:hypothetical protein
MTEEAKPLTVDEAQAALALAGDELQRLNAAAKASEGAYEIARMALSDARLRADEGLPRAKLIWCSWRGTKDSEREVVIIKRTAKRITVRWPGATQTSTFSLDGSGVWRQYPKPTRWNSPRSILEIDE